MLTDSFAGSGAMIKLALKRDRIIIPLFILFMIFLIVGIAAGFVNLYSDLVVRQAFYLQMQNNPSIVSFLGSVLDSSIGGLTAWRTGIPGPFIIGLISIFLMIRHTRSEERKGRLELVGSVAVGRLAALTSALAIAFGVNIIITVLIALGLIGLGLESASSLVLAASFGIFGCLFSSIAAVTVQLTESSGYARYLCVGILVAFFVLRILGWDDGSASWLSWLSPFGWVHYIRAFAGNDLWVFGLFLIFIVGLIIIAYWFSSIRDVGSGIITQRPGPASASKTLKSSLALTWRLQRGMLIFWIVIFALMGIMMGYTAQTVTDLISSNPQFLQLLSHLSKGGPADSYFALILTSFGEVYAVYAILAASRLRSEESQKRSEILLTNSVSRSQWMVSNLIFAVLGPALVMITFSLALGLTYGSNSGHLTNDLLRILAASLMYLPAVWMITGITMLLFGLLPRLTALSWAVLGLFVFVDLLGEFFDISQWIMNLSPFTQVPKLFAGDTVGTSLGWLFVLAVALMFIGLLGYRHRDING
jgi:polyether ionophore transport system permease protein